MNKGKMYYKGGTYRKSRTNKKNIFVSLLLIILLLGLAYVAYLLYSDKSPRQVYFQAEKNNYKKISQQLKEAHKGFVESQKPYMTDLYKSRFELTSEMNSESSEIFGLKNLQSILDAINKAKFIGNIETNPVNDESFVKASLLIDKSPLLDLEALVAGRNVSLTVPVLTPNTYYSIDMKKADEFYDRLIIPVKPKRFLRKVDVAKALSFSIEDLNGVSIEYGKLISGSITDENIEYGDTTSFNTGEDNIAVKEIILRLNSDESLKLLDKILEKVEQDNLLMRLTYENYVDLIALINETGFFQLFDYLEQKKILELNDFFKQMLKNANIKKDLAGLREKLEYIRKNTTYPKGFEMRVLIDNEGNIVNRAFHTSYKDANSDTINTIDFLSACNNAETNNLNSFNNMSLKLELGSTDTDGEKLMKHFSINTYTKPALNSGDTIKKTNIAIINKEGDIEKNAIKADFNVEAIIDKLTMKMNTLTEYKIDVSADDAKLVDSFSGEIRSEQGKNDKLKTTNTNTDILINLKLHSFGLKDMFFKFNLVSEDKFGIEPFELTNIQDKKLINLNTANDKELEKARMNILASFGSFYLENKQFIDALLGEK